MVWGAISILGMAACTNPRDKQEEFDKGQSRPNPDFISVKVSTYKDLDVVQFSNDYDFVLLSDVGNEPLGEVKKVIPFSDGYVIHDASREELLVFNLSGTYVQTLGRNGSGPMEYLGVQDFSLFEDKVSVLDYRGTLKEFNLANGQFIKEFTEVDGEFLRRVKSVVRWKNEHLLARFRDLYDVDQRSVIRFEDSGRIQSYFMQSYPQDTLVPAIIPNSYLSNPVNGSVLYLNRFSDTIYAIRDGYAMPYAHFDFGQNSINDQDRAELKAQGIGVIYDWHITKLKHTWFYELFSSENYDIFRGRLTGYIVYDKIRERLYLLRNIVQDGLGQMRIVGMKGNQTISVLDSENFIFYNHRRFDNYVKDYPEEEKRMRQGLEDIKRNYPKWAEIHEHLEDYDNPVLILSQPEFSSAKPFGEADFIFKGSFVELLIHDELPKEKE